MLYQLSYTRKSCGQRRIRTSVDLRRQIYSLLPLTTRPFARNPILNPDSKIKKFSNTFAFYPKKLSRREDLNPRPADYKSAALPTELHRQCIYTRTRRQKRRNIRRFIRKTNYFFLERFCPLEVSSTCQPKDSILSLIESDTFQSRFFLAS